MGAFNDYIVSGKYKLWKIDNNPGRQTEISPRTTDKVEPYAIITVDVFILDPQFPGGRQDFYWYIYLYDFVKYGKKIKRTQYITVGGRDKTKMNPFYDPSLKENLGGTKERLGG